MTAFTGAPSSHSQPEVGEDDFRDIIKQAHDFVRGTVLLREQETTDKNAIPDGRRVAAKNMGLFGFAISQQWGGLGRDLVDGRERRITPSAARLFCTEMVGGVADIAVQIPGGTGYMRDTPMERIYGDVRLLCLHEGTSEIQPLIIGSGLIENAKTFNVWGAR